MLSESVCSTLGKGRGGVLDPDRPVSSVLHNTNNSVRTVGIEKTTITHYSRLFVPWGRGLESSVSIPPEI